MGIMAVGVGCSSPPATYTYRITSPQMGEKVGCSVEVSGKVEGEGKKPERVTIEYGAQRGRFVGSHTDEVGDTRVEVPVDSNGIFTETITLPDSLCHSQATGLVDIRIPKPAFASGSASVRASVTVSPREDLQDVLPASSSRPDTVGTRRWGIFPPLDKATVTSPEQGVLLETCEVDVVGWWPHSNYAQLTAEVQGAKGVRVGEAANFTVGQDGTFMVRLEEEHLACGEGGGVERTIVIRDLDHYGDEAGSVSVKIPGAK